MSEVERTITAPITVTIEGVEVSLIPVVVQRSLWYRGKGSGHSALLVIASYEGAGKMCCAGFAAKACGATDEEIYGVRTLYGMYKAACDLVPKEALDKGAMSYAAHLYSTNDRQLLKDDQRESEIIALGKSIGFLFSFID